MMHNSTLVRLLRRFDKSERLELIRWVECPLFCRRAEVADLLRYIDRHIDRRPAALQKEAAWADLFPEKTFEAAKMNHLLSWTYDQAKQYLAWSEWQKEQPAGRAVYLCRALRERGLDDLFEREWKTAQAQTEALPFRDGTYYRDMYRLYQEQLRHRAGRNRATDLPLDEVTRYAGFAYQLDQLQLETSLIAIQLLQTPPANRNPTVEPPKTVEIFSLLRAAFDHIDDDTPFLHALSMLSTNWRLFSPSERRLPYLLAINYCTRKSNDGHSGYLRRLFDIYRECLETPGHGALLDHNLLSPVIYKNVVTTGLILKEQTWVRHFIDAFKPLLPPRERDRAYRYNLAVYYLHTGQYDEVLECLRDLQFGGDRYSELTARAMLLRIYYERGYDDALFSLLESFSAYLRRHRQEIGYLEAHYSQLLRMVKFMVNHRPLEKNIRESLKERILNTPAIAERKWLLEQVGAT